MEVTVISFGENAKGFWALVQWVEQGFLCTGFVKPVSLEGIEKGQVIKVPKVAIESK